MACEHTPPAREASGEREIYGEVEIERHVKDDGRALILYTYRQDDEPGEDRPA